MNEEKQIEEMAKVIASVPPIEFPIGSRLQGRHIYTTTKIAEHLYKADYRKQSEGEWKSHKDFNPFLRTDVIVGYICSCCENESDETTKFCPDCGAKMKGTKE